MLRAVSDTIMNISPYDSCGKKIYDSWFLGSYHLSLCASQKDFGFPFELALRLTLSRSQPARALRDGWVNMSSYNNTTVPTDWQVISTGLHAQLPPLLTLWSMNATDPKQLLQVTFNSQQFQGLNIALSIIDLFIALLTCPFTFCWFHDCCEWTQFLTLPEIVCFVG